MIDSLTFMLLLFSTPFLWIDELYCDYWVEIVYRKGEICGWRIEKLEIFGY